MREQSINPQMPETAKPVSPLERLEQMAARYEEQKDNEAAAIIVKVLEKT